MRSVWVAFFGTVALGFFTGGCLMAGNYHSAKTLEPGESSFGMTFSINNLVKDGDRETWPNLIPELTFHVGFIEDLEIGGRVALGALGLEADAKYRLLNNGNFHFALAPAIAYQAFFDVDGVSARLPAVLTLEVTGNFAISTALFASYSSLSSTDGLEDDLLFHTTGDIVSYGLAFGPEIRGTVFYVRPGVEIIRYQARLDEGVFDEDTWEPFNSVNILIHFGWVLGREKQQLDRIERKLDKVLEEKKGR